LRLITRRPDLNNAIEEPSCFFGYHLSELVAIEFPERKLMPDLKLEISCDVRAPFIGPRGSVATFSGQKGASESDKQLLENGMVHVSKLLLDLTGIDVSNIPGAGAAGGLPGSFIAVLGATMREVGFLFMMFTIFIHIV